MPIDPDTGRYYNDDDYEPGCTCHIVMPPCSWCTNLTEEEYEIQEAFGVRGVLDYRDAMDELDYIINRDIQKEFKAEVEKVFGLQMLNEHQKK